MRAEAKSSFWSHSLKSHPENRERSALSHLTEATGKVVSSPIFPEDRENPKGQSCTWSNFSFSAPPVQVLVSLANCYKKWCGWKRTETRGQNIKVGKKNSRVCLVKVLLSSPNMIIKMMHNFSLQWLYNWADTCFVLFCSVCAQSSFWTWLRLPSGRKSAAIGHPWLTLNHKAKACVWRLENWDAGAPRCLNHLEGFSGVIKRTS